MTLAKQVRSPATPSFALKDSFEDARKLYRKFSHAAFGPTEIASTLGLSATSSSLRKRIYALTEFTLLFETAGVYKVTQQFHTLDSSPVGAREFKRAALHSVENVATFHELMTEFSAKLPEQAIVAQRLEKQKGFTAERAKEVASIFERSMRFAGVLDSNGNILPIRDADGEKETSVSVFSDQKQDSNAQVDSRLAYGDVLELGTSVTRLRRSEIPLADGRMAVVFYPQDLASKEANKIGNVLSALVE